MDVVIDEVGESEVVTTLINVKLDTQKGNPTFIINTKGIEESPSQIP